VQNTFKIAEYKPFKINEKTVMVKKIYCSHCGYTLKHGAKAYFCKKSYQHGGENCFKGRIYEKDLYPIVLKKVKAIIGAYLEVNKPKRTVSEKQKLTQKLNHLQVKFCENFDRIADGKIDEKTFLIEKNKINLDIAETQTRLDELGSASALTDKTFGLESPLEKLKRLYNSETLTREHMVFVKRITVHSPENWDIIMDEREPLMIMSEGIGIYDGLDYTEKI
jgi:hypothetical protein